MTTSEAYIIVKGVIDWAVQKGAFQTTADVVKVHEAYELLKPISDGERLQGAHGSVSGTQE